MSTASETAGPPQGEPDTSRASSRAAANGRARTAAGEGALQAAKKTPAKSAAKRAAKTAKKSAPGAAAPEKRAGAKPAEPDAAPQSAPDPAESGSAGTERPAEDAGAAPAKTEGGGGGEPPQGNHDGDGGDGGGGSGPSGGGPAGVPWSRLGLYGLAGLAGGLVVALIFLLADGGGLRQQVKTLQTRMEKLQPAQGERAGSTGPVVPVRRKELRANLEQISEELGRLDASLSRLAGDMARTRGRLEALEVATPENLSEQLDRSSNRIEKLNSRIAQLERDEMTRDVRRASLALALAHLTRAVQTSRPFVHELKAIEVLDPGNRLVEALKPYAESGLPSVSHLAGRFDKVADDVVRVWRREHGRGFLEWLWDSIVGLFSVRPVGDVEGGNAPAIVARTEQRLQEGELYLAVQTLEKLRRPERAAAEEWLEAARARVRLDNLVAEVNRKVLEEIAEAEAERKAREAGFLPSEPEAEPRAGHQPAQPAEPEQEEPAAPEPQEDRQGETAPEPAPETDSAPEPEGGPSPSQDEAAGASER